MKISRDMLIGAGAAAVVAYLIFRKLEADRHALYTPPTPAPVPASVQSLQRMM